MTIEGNSLIEEVKGQVYSDGPEVEVKGVQEGARSRKEVPSSIQRSQISEYFQPSEYFSGTSSLSTASYTSMSQPQLIFQLPQIGQMITPIAGGISSIKELYPRDLRYLHTLFKWEDS